MKSQSRDWLFMRSRVSVFAIPLLAVYAVTGVRSGTWEQAKCRVIRTVWRYVYLQYEWDYKHDMEPGEVLCHLRRSAVCLPSAQMGL
jgi:hypothetical protein